MAQTVSVVDDSPSEVQAALVLAVNELIAQFEAHKHQVDNSGAGGASDITGLAVTGTTTGTPAGGALISLTTGPIVTRV
jgi:hypothetical protein